MNENCRKLFNTLGMTHPCDPDLIPEGPEITEEASEAKRQNDKEGIKKFSIELENAIDDGQNEKIKNHKRPKQFSGAPKIKHCVSSELFAQINRNHVWTFVDGIQLGFTSLDLEVFTQTQSDSAHFSKFITNPGCGKQYWCNENNPFEIAIKSGNLSVAAWLDDIFQQRLQAELKTKVQKLKQICRGKGFRFGGGKSELIQRLSDGITLCNLTEATEIAASRGHLDVVEWLYSHRQNTFTAQNSQWWGCSWSTLAAQNGHLSVLKWLYNKKKASNYEWSIILGVTAKAGHLDVLEWCKSKIATDDDYDFDYIASNQMYSASKGGHVHILEWLHRHGNLNGCVDGVMLMALNKGHLHVFEWLHYHHDDRTVRNYCNCRYHESLMITKLAENGHLHKIEWVHNHQQEFSENVASQIADNFQSPDPMDGAAANGHLHVVEWLRAHCQGGCTSNAIDGAAVNGHLHVVEWLHTHRQEGCTTEAMDGAAREGHLHVVEWLHMHRQEGCTTEAMDDAAREGNLHVLEWLHAHRQEGCTKNAMDGAAEKGQLHVLEWLRNVRRHRK